MDAYFTAHITGWCSFRLESLSMMFFEGSRSYVLPVTWKSQQSGLMPRCMRPDRMFCFKLTGISVNGKDASGFLRFFSDARISSCSITLRGAGKKDFEISQILLHDGKHQSLVLPESQSNPQNVYYKTFKSPGKRPDGLPRTIKDRHGHIGCFIKNNDRRKTAKYLFINGYEEELPYKALKKNGCGRNCII